MSLLRWNPTRDRTSWPSDLSGFQREMNKLFDTFLQPAWGDEETSLSLWTPAVDITERENEFTVKVELPGVDKKDVSITLESNILTIRGTKNQEKEEKGREYHRIERSYGSFHRSFTLPTSVKADTIDAIFKEGILQITLPKAEEAKSKQIEVKVQ